MRGRESAAPETCAGPSQQCGELLAPFLQSVPVPVRSWCPEIRLTTHLQTQALLFAELASARSFRHPNLHVSTSALVADGSLVLVYEPCPIALPDIQRRWSTGLPLGDVKRLMSQLVSATAHLHAAGLCHRGIRPRAIMLSEEGVLKLGGLESTCAGVALKGGAATARHTASTALCAAAGTGAACSYTAPEVILRDDGSSGGSFPADIWAIGCICAELATGLSWVAGGAATKGQQEANMSVVGCSSHLLLGCRCLPASGLQPPALHRTIGGPRLGSGSYLLWKRSPLP